MIECGFGFCWVGFEDIVCIVVEDDVMLGVVMKEVGLVK